MDTTQAETAIGAICAYFDCESAVPLIMAGIHNTQAKVGDDYATTGVVHKHAGNEWWIAFPAPAGYMTCNAAYDPKTISANGGDATSGTVFRNPQSGENWVGSYNSVRQRDDHGHWASVNFVVKYVKVGSEGRHDCVANGTRIWDAHGG